LDRQFYGAVGVVLRQHGEPKSLDLIKKVIELAALNLGQTL
jgi:hypothetical protein